MTKFLSSIIQKSIFCKLVCNMSKRTGFYRAPRFKPEVKIVKNRKKNLNILTNRTEKVDVLTEPIKSESDKKLYKTIRLENGLTVLLISDPSRPPPTDGLSSDEKESGSEESSGGMSDDSDGSNSDSGKEMKNQNFNEEKLAAAALCVGVGSYSDPPDIQGLAHFVEHMVFMGSEKYPRENEFDAFIKKKGGSDNASTDCEVTTFYFEIPEEHLAQAMDIFSQFFVGPLMLRETMQREREAIESEFAIQSTTDSNRKDQLLSSLFPPGHPATTFTWGNMKSLRDDLHGDDDKLHAAAHDFRLRHYSAHRMTLAVQARMELPALERHVVSTFARVPSNGRPPSDFSRHRLGAAPAPGRAQRFGGLFYVKPIGDVTEVQLTWCMRPLLQEYESKPHQYISYLLGHEGKGSLLSYLREKVWALGIYTGNSQSGIDYTSIYSLFSAQVVLTQEGLEHVDEVLEVIFSYINMMKQLGPSERIYNEIKAIGEMSFRYEEESSPADYVEMLAENMHRYPPQHYITGDKLYYKYDPQGIMQLLEYMSPERANIMILSNKHSQHVQYDQREKWFGTDYKRQDIPTDWLHRWQAARPYEGLHLPKPNVFITTDFNLIPPAEPYASAAERLGVSLQATAQELHARAGAGPQTFRDADVLATVKDFRLDQPNLFRKTNLMEVWYKPDFKFRFPTALLYFYFITPLTLKSPKESCLLDLWTDVLQQELKEQVYEANMADLSHSIYVGDKGLVVKISGYNQNLHLVMELITRAMRGGGAGGGGARSAAMFAAVRDVRARLYHNVLIKPTKLSKDVRMQALLEPYVSARDKAAAARRATLDQLQDFEKRFLGKMYLQMLVQGNMAWHEAIRISDMVFSNLQWEAIPEEQMPKVGVHLLAPGSRSLLVPSFNVASASSVVTNYYQLGPADDHSVALLEILMMLMEEPAFDQLRTKEQLGYTVYALMRYTFGVLGYSITVNTQVDKFSVSHVEARVDAFVAAFARGARRLSERRLATARRALLQLKHSADFELRDEVDKNWNEIVNGEYKFNRMFQEAEAIEKVQLADLKAWVERHLASTNGTDYKKLSIQVMGHKQMNPELMKNSDSEPAPEPALPHDYRLTYLISDGTTNTTNGAEYITDIDEFKKNASLFFQPPVELPECP